MKNASRRTQLGERQTEGSNFVRQFRKYDSVKESAEDLIILLEWNRFPTNLSTSQELANELKSDGYYTVAISQYAGGVERFLA